MVRIAPNFCRFVLIRLVSVTNATPNDFHFDKLSLLTTNLLGLRVKKAISVIVVLLIVSACNPSTSFYAIPSSKAVATKFLDEFLSVSPEETEGYFVPEFWDDMPKETWAKILPNIVVELGQIESCELSNWQQSTSASTNGSGNFVGLVYSCKHQKYESSITLNFVTPLSGGDTKIQGFNINSLGLLIE